MLRIQGGSFEAWSFTFSADGKLLASQSKDGTIHLWETATSRKVRSWRAHPRSHGYLYLAFSPDSQTLASASGDGTTRLWDTATGRRLDRFGQGPVVAVALPADSRILIAADSATFRLWDMSTSEEQRQLPHPGKVVSITVSADGRTPASGGDSALDLWDLATGHKLHSLQQGPISIRSIAFAPDGKSLASGSVQTQPALRLWDAATGKELRSFPGHRQVSAVGFSPDGKILASGGYDHVIRLWDVATGKELRQLAGHQQKITAMAFWADGRLLVSASGFETVGEPMRLWEVATGNNLCQFAGHRGDVNSVALSPDGKTVAAGAWHSYFGSTIGLWEVATGQERGQTPRASRRDYDHPFTADGRRLISGSVDSTVLVWDMTGRSTNGKLRPLEDLWTDLAGADAAKSYRALGSLEAVPAQSVPFLQERLKPVAPADPKRLAQLVADLDSDRFAVRKKASTELEQLGELAEPALMKVLAGQPSPEVQSRVASLLALLHGPISSPYRLPRFRGAEVLEHIGTQEAHELLEKLAQGRRRLCFLRKRSGLWSVWPNGPPSLRDPNSMASEV